MNQTDRHALLASLDEAVAILDRNRTPDPTLIAAYDTLKQARARIVRVLDRSADEAETASGVALELAA